MKKQGYFYGLKLNKIKRRLFDLAVDCQLEILFKSEEKGFIKTTVFFDVTGEKKDIDTFFKTIPTRFYI